MAKAGRKPKGEYSGKSAVFSTRIRPDTRDALWQAAKASGRTLSQEVEFRLRRSIDEDGELVLAPLVRKGLEQLPAEPAEPPTIGKAASVDSNSHDQTLV